jgi:RecA/RadA recombinase
MAGIYGRECKHIKVWREANRNMPVEIDEIKYARSVPSFLKGLNEMAGGDFYNSDVIVALHGKPGVGKTLYALHECASMASAGVNVLIVDTEGGLKSAVEKWWPKLSRRFERRGKVYVETRKSLHTLHEFLGFRTEFSVHKKSKESEGKMEFRILETIQSPEIDNFVKQQDVGFIVVDSVSMPVTTAISEEQQNRPARYTATALIMGKLAELQERYGACVLTVHHSSWNPANQYEIFAQMRGGKIVHHYSKRVLYMDARKKDELSNFRRMWLARAEDVERFADVAFLAIDDDGMHDIDIKTGYEAGLLTDAEVEYVKETERWKEILAQKRRK